MEEGEEIVLEGGEGADDDEYEQVLPPSADDHYDLGLANIGYMLIDDTCLSVSYLSTFFHTLSFQFLIPLSVCLVCLSPSAFLAPSGSIPQLPPPLFLSGATLRARPESAKT